MTTSVALPTVADGSPVGNRSRFQAGARPYAADYYVPGYLPPDTNLLCTFRIQPAPGVETIEASAAVAAESSTGTWTEVWSNQLTDIDYFKAKVHRIEDDIAYVLEGSREETLGITDLLRERVTPEEPSRGVYCDQGFAGLKAVWPVASGGIYVLNIPDLCAIYGNDAFWLFGGGTHGHPRGSRAGARADRVAAEAVASGKTLEEAARSCPELREAMELWGQVKFVVSE